MQQANIPALFMLTSLHPLLFHAYGRLAPSSWFMGLAAGSLQRIPWSSSKVNLQSLGSAQAQCWDQFFGSPNLSNHPIRWRIGLTITFEDPCRASREPFGMQALRKRNAWNHGNNASFHKKISSTAYLSHFKIASLFNT